MPNDKVKFYKNSDRNNLEVRKPYVSQYQILGVEPEEFIPSTQKKNESPDLHKSGAKIVQPYAKIIPSPIGRGRGLVPNVGNNMEHTWSSVDGEIVNDLTDEFDHIDINHNMIDNNDVVTSQALGISDSLRKQTTNIMTKSFPEEGYSLFVFENFISSDTLEKIQEQVRLLVFGEHPLFMNKPVLVEDIFVFKIDRVKIKVGVFLE